MTKEEEKLLTLREFLDSYCQGLPMSPLELKGFTFILKSMIIGYLTGEFPSDHSIDWGKFKETEINWRRIIYDYLRSNINILRTKFEGGK